MRGSNHSAPFTGHLVELHLAVHGIQGFTTTSRTCLVAEEVMRHRSGASAERTANTSGFGGL